MAEDKSSILVYADWINIFEELEDAEAGKLIKHFFRYVNDKNPEAPDRLTKLLFEPIKQTLKRDLVKYEAKREINRHNARLRWEKLDAVASDGIKTDANHAVSGSVPVSVPVPVPVPDSVSDNKEKSTTIEKVKIDFQFIIDNYHSLCPKMNKVQVINKTREGYMNARVGEFGMEKVIYVIRQAGESKFLNGENENAWKADFEWILRPTNFLKILEGKYNVVNNKLKTEYHASDY